MPDPKPLPHFDITKGVPSEIWVAIGRDHYSDEYALAIDVAKAVRAEQAETIERLELDNYQLESRQRGADKLAYVCAQAIERRTVGSRSAIGDALLSYLDIGGLDGPSNVPTWVEQYEAAEAAKEKS